jgi:hypothetical protein
MAINRRQFLQGAGLTVLVVVGGTVYRSVAQGVLAVGQGPAYEAWRNWRTEAVTPQQRIVKAAILASNPHNSQPWLFQITPNAITLFADTKRQIGTIDPFLREMTIGLGCAVENMVLAAQAEGFAPDVQLLPDVADRTQVARIVLTPAAKVTSDLYEAIPNRHTDRAAYDTARALPTTTFDTMTALNQEPDVRLFWFESAAAHAQFSDVATRATTALINDQQQSLDSHVWWRQGWDAVQQSQDGLTLDAQGLTDVVTLAAKILPDLSREQNDQSFLEMVRTVQLPTASAFGMLAVTDGRDTVQRLKVGQYWQRLHLWAVTQGLSVQPLNQMCERADREQQLGIMPEFGNALQAMLNAPAWTGIMPFRIGYPTRAAKLSPRRSIDKVTV